MQRYFVGFAMYLAYFFATITRLISSVIRRLLNLKIYKLQKHYDMFGIEGTNGLQKLIYSLLDGLRNFLILWWTVCGIILFLDRLFAKLILSTDALHKLFYSSTKNRLRKYWCVDLHFFKVFDSLHSSLLWQNVK